MNIDRIIKKIEEIKIKGFLKGGVTYGRTMVICFDRISIERAKKKYWFSKYTVRIVGVKIKLTNSESRAVFKYAYKSAMEIMDGHDFEKVEKYMDSVVN